MGNRVELSAFDQPWTWYVCFHERCDSPFIARMTPDKFKHVSAVGYSSRTNTWIFFEPAMSRTRILTALNDREGEKIIALWFSDAVVVEMHVPPNRKRKWRPGGWCVPMIVHLLAIPSRAVFPSGLLRDCLKFGGRIISRGSTIQPPSTSNTEHNGLSSVG